MDQRGQISVEFVLFAAIVLLVVLAFGLVVSDQNELNSVATAVRTGAENGTTYLSVNNATMQPVRVTKVDMTGTGNINIQVYFSSSVSSIQDKILSSINQSLSSEGFNTGFTGGNQINFQTTRHNYTITLVT